MVFFFQGIVCCQLVHALTNSGKIIEREREREDQPFVERYRSIWVSTFFFSSMVASKCSVELMSSSCPCLYWYGSNKIDGANGCDEGALFFDFLLLLFFNSLSPKALHQWHDIRRLITKEEIRGTRQC